MRRLAVLSLLVVLSTDSHATPRGTGLPIVNDDVAGARARAQRRHVPIFVEAWAPW